MILRYGVETKHTKTFTASRFVEDLEQAKKKIESLRNANIKAGYGKYYSPVLYTESNQRVFDETITL